MFDPFFRQVLPGLHGSGKNRAAKCPFHEDSSPSFSVNVETGLWQCHGCKKSGNAKQFAELMNIAPPEAGNGQPKRVKTYKGKQIISTYDYRSESGVLLFSVHRTSDKEFPAQAADGKWSLEGVRRVLYRLPELIASGNDPVLIVEGEKDVETARALGFTATCNPGGSGKWRTEYSDSLNGRQCIVIPDNDQVGMDHADLVMRELSRVGAEAKILRLSKGKDLTEWVEAGGNKEDLAELVAVCMPPPQSEFDRMAITDTVLSETDLPPLPSILGERIVITNTYAVLHGPEGLGKTFLLLQLAYAVSTGIPWLGIPTTKTKTLYVGTEINHWILQERMREVRKLMGAEDSPLPSSDDLTFLAPPLWNEAVDLSDPKQAKKLADYVREKAFGLVVMDPLSDFHTLKENSNDDMAIFLKGVKQLNLAGASTFMAHHDRKAMQGQEDTARGAMRGASKLRTSATAVFHLTETPQKIYKLALEKTNFASPMEPIFLRQGDYGGYTVTSPPEEIGRARESRQADICLALARAQRAGMPIVDVYKMAELADVSLSTRQRDISLLVKAGQVVSTGKSKFAVLYSPSFAPKDQERLAT